MDTNSASVSVQGFSVENGDGKAVITPAGFRMVKISQSVQGKRGKGKTIKFCLIPSPIALFVDDFDAMRPMLSDICTELQNSIVRRIGKGETSHILADQISLQACLAEHAAQSFSPEGIIAFFDSEVSEVLAFQIITASGLTVDALTEAQQKKIQDRVNAYRASFAELGKRGGGSLDPDQRAELLRVANMLEFDGSIGAKIIEELTPKTTSTVLGFAL